MPENRMTDFMKKKRYSKPERTEVPSRRKLAMEVAKAQAEAALLDLDLKRRQLDLVDLRQACNEWMWRASSAEGENARLRKQVEAMMPPERFLHVFPVRGFRHGEVEEMLRVQTLHLPRVHLVVEVGLEHMRMREMRDPAAYKEALADHIARQARKVVMEGLQIR